MAYDSTGWANLVGRFTLVTVITSEGLAGHVKRTLLRLDTVAASERWFRSDGLRGPRGALRFRPVRGVEITRFRGELWRDSAEVEGTVLYTGCRECTDASPVEYEIQFVSAWGFWGRWRNRQTGIVRALDRTGRNLAADPAGYFCALRQ